MAARILARGLSLASVALLSSITASMGTCQAQSVSAETMLPLHLEAARQYQLFPGGSENRPAELVEQPLFVWSNPRRGGGQVGHIFLWTAEEYPAAVASIFSGPYRGNRRQQRIVHELHALTESKMESVNRSAVQEWTPSSGTDFYSIPRAGNVPATDTRRLLRARQLSRSFDAHTVDRQMQRWELRTLPKELLAYEGPTRAGALFAMLGDVGADPELMLLIEGKRQEDSWQWRFAPIRMTDHEIFLSFAGQEIWTSVHNESNTRFHSHDKTYFRFPDAINPLPVPADKPDR